MTVLVNPYVHAHVWVPTDVSGLIGWWDASDAASITTVSGAVSQWNDKSGNNNHLAQATSGCRPTLTTDSTTGYGSVVFDGTDDALTAASSSSLQPTTGASWFMAAKFGSTASSGKYIFTKDGGGWNGWIIYTHGSTSNVVADINGAAEINMLVTPWTGRHALTAMYDKTNLKSRKDLADVSSTAYSSNINTNTSDLAVGARNSGGTSAMAITIFEIIYYNAHIGNTNRDVVEAYLKAKWSTA